MPATPPPVSSGNVHIVVGDAASGAEMSCFESLKDKGYRLTPQRLMVLETLHAAEGHISAPEIFNRVRAKYPYVNKSTVYRTLQLLKDLDLVTETQFGEDTLYYHQAEKGHHHHLICEKCGQEIEIDEDVFASLKGTLRNQYQFCADLRHLAIRGRCLKCQS
jgi:Fur family ferric uptake transcriptional regulator